MRPKWRPSDVAGPPGPVGLPPLSLGVPSGRLEPLAVLPNERRDVACVSRCRTATDEDDEDEDDGSAWPPAAAARRFGDVGSAKTASPWRSANFESECATCSQPLKGGGVFRT